MMPSNPIHAISPSSVTSGSGVHCSKNGVSRRSNSIKINPTSQEMQGIETEERRLEALADRKEREMYDRILRHSLENSVHFKYRLQTEFTPIRAAVDESPASLYPAPTTNHTTLLSPQGYFYMTSDCQTVEGGDDCEEGIFELDF